MVIDAYLDQQSVEEKLDSFFDSIPETEQVIMLSDLYGGSVNQKMYLHLNRPNTFLVAGMNLALVLQLLLKNGPIDLEKLEEIVEESRNAIKVVELEPTGDEEDFWRN